MAENENRVSAVQEAPDSPQEPAALDTPPSEMPVYEPARPVRRVGTLTMGLALVVVGAALCVGLFFPNVDFLLLFKLSPLVLVALGCEVIFAASTAKGMRLKYDFLSMFVCFLLIVTALGAACVPVALQYAGPGRSAAEQRLTVGGTVLDYRAMSATCGGKPVPLSAKEFQLLYKLLSYPETLLTKRQLIDELWDLDSDVDEHTVEVHISRLREKFRGCPDFHIRTIRGFGYMALPGGEAHGK